MTVDVGIAGVGLRFTSDNPHTDPLLRQRFGGFLTEEAEPIEIDLHLTGDVPLTDARGTLAMSECDNALELSGDSTRAAIAADNRSATITGPLAAHPIDTVVRLLVARTLLERGALLVHASAVARANGGVVFIGPSGSGKTTVATTLPGAVLADEAIALVPEGDGVEARGTPYWRGSARTVPLDQLVFLSRSDTPAWEPMPVSWTAAKLFTAAGPLPESANAAALEAATALAQRSPRAAQVALADKADILDWLAPRLEANG